MDSAEKRDELASGMRTILGEHRRLWSARNRVGGLQDSERVFEERLREYQERVNFEKRPRLPASCAVV